MFLGNKNSFGFGEATWTTAPRSERLHLTPIKMIGLRNTGIQWGKANQVHREVLQWKG